LIAPNTLSKMNFLLKNAQKYEVADLYAGIVQSTLHLDVQSELRDCFVRDQDLVDIWSAAITGLSTGNEEAWRTNFSAAILRSQNDTEACASSAKLRTAGRQLDNWWETFWS